MLASFFSLPSLGNRKRGVLAACQRTMNLSHFSTESQEVPQGPMHPAKSSSKKLFWNICFQCPKHQIFAGKLSIDNVCFLLCIIRYVQNRPEVLLSEELGVDFFDNF